MAIEIHELPHVIYDPLEHSQIRILRLAPGKKGDTLVGVLLLADFEDKFIEYDALSYMWGDPTPTDTLLLSNRALRISNNLATALRHLRYTEKPLMIWVDAICINQEDIGERSSQVSLMRRIYTSANTVRVWINEPAVDANCEAVAALQAFHLATNDPDHGEARLGADLTLWAPVGPIFTNRYWKRAWV
jgi:hypothetical protein